MSDSSLVVTNKLLSALLVVTQQRLLPYLERVSLTSGQIIKEPNTPLTALFFPETARFSLVSIFSPKTTTEILAIGREGILGIETILGDRTSNWRYLVQISGSVTQLPVTILQTEFEQNRDLRQLLLVYQQFQFSYLCQIAACRCHHNLQQRLARWLLLIYDSTQDSTLPLTQQFIASMLGVRRASITEIALSLQKQNIIQYRRGKITILNPTQLQGIACECYGKIKSEYQRLLKPTLNSIYWETHSF